MKPGLPPDTVALKKIVGAGSQPARQWMTNCRKAGFEPATTNIGEDAMYRTNELEEIICRNGVKASTRHKKILHYNQI